MRFCTKTLDPLHSMMEEKPHVIHRIKLHLGLLVKGEDKKLFLTRLRQWSATQPNTCIKLKIFMWLPVYVHFNFECWILLHPNSTIITSYVMTRSNDSLSMKEIKEGDDFNLICKVLLGQHVFIAFQCILGSKCLILFENHV